MRVYLGSDHAGFELKSVLVVRLAEWEHEPVDCGPHTFNPDDDYPPYCMRVGLRVAGDPGSLGVVIGGSGNGEQIAANKIRGVRAALAWNEETARLAREHNDATVVSIGARMHDLAEAVRLVEVFVTAPFGVEERHRRRIAMVNDYEEFGVMPSGDGGDPIDPSGSDGT